MSILWHVRKTNWGKEVSTLQRTSLMLPTRIWKAIRIRAVHENRNAQEIVAEALEDYLKKFRKGGKADER